MSCRDLDRGQPTGGCDGGGSLSVQVRGRPVAHPFGSPSPYRGLLTSTVRTLTSTIRTVNSQSCAAGRGGTSAAKRHHQRGARLQKPECEDGARRSEAVQGESSGQGGWESVADGTLFEVLSCAAWLPWRRGTAESSVGVRWGSTGTSTTSKAPPSTRRMDSW